MYKLCNNLTSVKGIGPVLAEKFNKKNLYTIKDLLLSVPLRYEDSSLIVPIKDALILTDQTLTIKASIKSISQYFKNRKTILNVTIEDESGSLKCMWFNNKFLKQSLNEDEWYYFSGTVNDRGYMMQPRVEKDKEERIHTGRLVPIYTSSIGLQQGKLRILLKEIVDNLTKNDLEEDLITQDKYQYQDMDIQKTFSDIHFPESEDHIVESREALALEELLALVDHSAKLKNKWEKEKSAFAIESPTPDMEEADVASDTKSTNKIIPDTIPFTLTNAQKRSTNEVLKDISQSVPMNRLMIGDVGSGKTVVAGIACHHTILNKHSVAFIAPTQILVEQHAKTLSGLFPDISIEIITMRTSKKLDKELTSSENIEPTLYVGTHSLINRLDKIKPALVIFDEQHRFGVNHRSQSLKLDNQPHILSMTATPIPRSLMLTLFSHLEVSVIDELPKGRKPVKTWLIPEQKRQDSMEWIVKQLLDNPLNENLAIIVCPFIDPSNHAALENIASAKDIFKKVKEQVDTLSDNNLTTALLHGKLSKSKKDRLIKDLFDKKINVLVTTPIVEVGIDLPSANIIVIEAAERFGMASLHQLRGRVGRAGQESYCLLFTSPKKPSSGKSKSAQAIQTAQNSKKRLKHFTQENNGIKLAEQDLKNRGAGNIFGVQQHGISNLKFASWANMELIAKASKEYKNRIKNPIWIPFILPSGTDKKNILAN